MIEKIKSFNRPSDKNISLFYLIELLLVLSITLPHAILTLILLRKGIEISQIALIQFFYNFAMLIFELPSGVISDNYSRKKTFVLSLIFLFVAFFIIFFSSSIYFLSAAWFIYGLSQALNTGTIDSDMINYVKESHSDYYQDFFRNSRYISLLGSIAGSGIGFLLYRFIGERIYLVSLLIISINIIITIFLYQEKSPNLGKTINIESIKDHLYLAKKEIMDKDLVKYPIISLVILQIYLQFHFHYWQAIFLENNVSEDYFYGIYVLFQLVSVLISKVNIDKFNIRNLQLLSIVSIVSVIVSFNIGLRGLDLIIYIVVLTYFMLVSYLSSYILNKYVSRDRISSIVSFNSTLQRIVSSISLLLFAFFLKIVSLKFTFVTISIILTIIEFVICKKIIEYKNKEKLFMCD